MSNALNRAAILGVRDSKVEKVECPEWGGDVYVRNLTAGQLDKYEASLRSKDESGDYVVDMSDHRARLCCLGICDPEGNPLFTPDDEALLTDKNGAVVERIFDRIGRLSGMGKQAKAELAKNSSGQAGDSSSA